MRIASSRLLGVACALLLLGAPARALERADEQALARLIAAGEKPQTIQLNDAAIQHYRAPEGEVGAREFLVISRAGATPIKLADRRFVMRMMQVGGNGPNAIFIGESETAPPWRRAHLLWIERELRLETIALGPGDLTLESGGGAPRLRFGDPSFLDWHADAERSPAPAVVLAYDAAERRYVADLAAMRRPPPEAPTLSRDAAEIRGIYAALPADELDPRLWTAMLDLIYAGNAAAARGLLDDAWPAERPGEDAFLTDFSRRLWAGEAWRRFELGPALEAERAFPRVGRR